MSLGNLTIDFDRRAVLINDRHVPLTFLEYELFMELLRNLGKVLSRDHLLEAVWKTGDDAGPGRRLAVHICRLRKKLQGSEPWTIANVRKRGYVLRRNDAAEAKIA